MVVDRFGVLLQVDYEKSAQRTLLNCIRVMDASYRPVGPNLAPLLLETYMLVEPHVAESVLSTIVGELNE